MDRHDAKTGKYIALEQFIGQIFKYHSKRGNWRAANRKEGKSLNIPVSAWPAGPASKPVLSRPVSSVQVKKKRKSLRERNFLAFASRICSARPAGSYARPSDRVLAFFLSTNCGVCGCRDQPRRRLGGQIWPERLQRDDGLGPKSSATGRPHPYLCW
jgi:hypothetical protein